MKAHFKTIFMLIFLFFFSAGYARRHSAGEHIGVRSKIRGAWNYFVAKKHIIGSRPTAGLFSNFCGVLNHLDWCEKKGMTPVVYWDQDSLYWQHDGYNGSFNVWEYYFEPVSSQTAAAHEPRDHSYAVIADDMAPFGHTLISRETVCCANALINKYITANAIVKKKVESFFAQHMVGKKTIGIHLRGTDKKSEIPFVDPLVILARANKEAEQLGDCQFLVATDEYRLLELAKEKLNRPVLYYSCQRSCDTLPLHTVHSSQGKAVLGEEVLIEVLLLARCNLFLHTYSNVSAAVLYFNATLKNILFT